MTPSQGSDSRWREPWWTVDPQTGEPIEVVPAAAVDELRAITQDAEVKVGVMREAAARLRPLARRAVTEGGASGDEARRELPEAIAHIARGCPAEARS